MICRASSCDIIRTSRCHLGTQSEVFKEVVDMIFVFVSNLKKKEKWGLPASLTFNELLVGVRTFGSSQFLFHGCAWRWVVDNIHICCVCKHIEVSCPCHYFVWIPMIVYQSYHIFLFLVCRVLLCDTALSLPFLMNLIEFIFLFL